MYTRDRVSAFSPLGVRYAVGHYSFMIWPVIISTMEVVCGNKDRSQHMRAREAQAQERGREMEQIYGAWYSHFARSCYTFWARGFPDMIEFECTLPYTKVSACCVNISCKHFVSIRGPLYRPIEETTRLIVHLRWRGPRVVVRLDERTCAPRKNTSLDREAERKTRRKIKQSAKKEDASSCRFGCSEPCWAEPTNFQLCRCTCRLIPIQGGVFHVMRTAAAHRLTYCSCPSRVSLRVGKKFAVTQILEPVIDVFLFLFSLQLCSFQGTVIHQLEWVEQ